jgi:hypothetical protein
MSDSVLTIREVAELLKINEKTVYKLAAESKNSGFQGWWVMAFRPRHDRQMDREEIRQ